MNLPIPFRRRSAARSADPTISFNEWGQMLAQFQYQGVNYSLPTASQEEIAGNFVSLSQLAYKGNGIVFSCMLVRMLLFSEARFQFRQIRNGRPGDLFGDKALAPLETPGPGMTTGDLLSRAIQHADLGGNWFGTNKYGGVVTLQPNWVTIVAGSPRRDASIWDPETEVAGYSYQPGGPGSGEDPIMFLPEEVAHFAPIPDPEARFRGMSWLTPIVREVMADKAMTEHKLSFLENGATPQLVVKLDVPDLAKFKQWQEHFQGEHEGFRNAYKTLFLGAGADATVVGSDLKQLDFKVSQGAGETRVAAAAGTPPVLVGLSEGLASATYSNYLHARRRFGDMTMRPLWRNFAGSMARIIPVPTGAELWYDDRDIPALQEDQKDAAEIQSINAAAISSLITSGYEPDSVVAAITAGDLSRLTHTGLFSVQLQRPGTTPPPTPPPAPATNGSNGKNGNRDDLLGELLRLSEAKRKDPIQIHNHLPEQEPARVDIHEGAIVSHTTVEAGEPARVDIHEGAFRSETTVEPAQVTVEPAVIHNHMPEQEPPRVEIAEGAFRSETTVEPAQVTVEAPNVTVEAPEPTHITVEAARAPDVNVNIEPPPPAEVKVQVDAPEPSHITVEAARAPDVHVNVEPTTVEAAPTPEVHIHPPEQRPRSAKASRDKDGNLTVTYHDEENQDG